MLTTSTRLPKEASRLLADHQAQQLEGYLCVLVHITRYDCIPSVLRQKGKWALTDFQLKVVNNLRRQFKKSLEKPVSNISAFWCTTHLLRLKKG